MPFSEAGLDCEIVALNKPGIGESLTNNCKEMGIRPRRNWVNITQQLHPGLLSPGHHRPRRRTTDKRDELPPPHDHHRGSGQGMVAAQTRTGKGLDVKVRYTFYSEGPPDVRFGSKADMCSAKGHVRFAPESRHLQCKSACPLYPNSGHSSRLIIEGCLSPRPRPLSATLRRACEAPL